MSDIWMVQLPTGEVRWTLDELDAAYQADRVDESTLVRSPGAPWQTLGSLLGVEPEVKYQSVRPVSIDLEVDLPPMKSNAGRNVLVALAVVGLVAGGGFLAFTKLRAPVQTPARAAAVVAPPIMIATTPAPTPSPVADKPSLSDSQKDALVKADQDRAKKAKDAKDARTKKAAQPKSKPVFTKGGAKYDPLNGKL